jgi:phosphoribosyl-ATP pyrophosphohydrolase
MPNEILNTLFKTIEARKNADATESYVASLFEKGTAKIAQKVGEEAVETCIEAIQGDKKKTAEESADLLFHLMILWSDAGITPENVTEILEKRMGISGHDEKASR